MFSIGAATGARQRRAASGSVNGLIWLARIGVYLGLFVGVGGVFFAAGSAGRARVRGVIIAALLVGLVSAVASLGLQGLDLLDLAAGAAATAAPWKAAAATSLDQSLLIAMAAMIAGILRCEAGRPAIAATLSALAMAGVGLSLAASGHAATAPPQWLTAPGGVPARRRRRLLGRRAGAAGGDGAAAGATACCRSCAGSQRAAVSWWPCWC